MKLTSWNCSSSPQIKHPETASRLSREKAALLSPLAAEINVFQEIANPGTPANSRQDWSGSHPGRGIGVISAGSYAVERVPEYPPGRSAHPLRVHGPQTFHLLAIWSRPQRSSLRNYCHEVVDAIEAHQAFLQEAPAVIAGDFNSNALWDRQVGERNHSYLVSRLRAEFGLKSAYHDYFQVPQGEEVHPTFYQYRHRDKPFHLDYCFVPDSWRVIGVHVGEWSKWHTYSDHCPLTSKSVSDRAGLADGTSRSGRVSIWDSRPNACPQVARSETGYSYSARSETGYSDSARLGDRLQR